MFECANILFIFRRRSLINEKEMNDLLTKLDLSKQENYLLQKNTYINSSSLPLISLPFALTPLCPYLPALTPSLQFFAFTHLDSF